MNEHLLLTINENTAAMVLSHLRQEAFLINVHITTMYDNSSPSYVKNDDYNLQTCVIRTLMVLKYYESFFPSPPASV